MQSFPLPNPLNNEKNGAPSSFTKQVRTLGYILHLGRLGVLSSPNSPPGHTGCTWDINGASIAPMRHSEPLVPIPKARIVVG